MGEGVQENPRHGVRVERALGRSPVANRGRDLLVRPGAEAGRAVGREVPAHVIPVRVEPDPHAAGEIEVVGAVDAGAVDDGVTQAAHLGVDQVFAPRHQVGLVPRPVELPAWRPGRWPRERLHVAHEVPALGRRGRGGEGRHGAGRESGGQAEPHVLRFTASPERPRGREIARQNGVAFRVFQHHPRPAVAAVAGDAALAGEQGPAPGQARPSRGDRGRHRDRPARRRRGRSRQGLHVRHDRADRRRVEHVVPVGHGARRQAVGNDANQICIGGRLGPRSGLVFELAEREIARAGD